MPYGRRWPAVCSRSLLAALLASAAGPGSAAAGAAERTEPAPDTGSAASADDGAAASLELFRTGVESEERFDEDLERARALRDTREYVDALRILEDLLGRVRTKHGQWDMRNVAVLAELGRVQQALGNLRPADGLYRQALHVTRVNQGLHDLSQVDILQDLTEVQVELGDYETANQIQEYALYIQQRTHGQGSPATLPGLYRLAEWWRRTGNIFSARALYEQAVRIIEANYGPRDIRLVDALHGIAGTYRQERYPTRPLVAPEENDFTVTSQTGGMGAMGAQTPFVDDTRMRLNHYGQGEEALLRIVEIVDGQPGVTPRERAQARLELGDWYIVFDKWSAAFEAYAEVRELLLEAGWDPSRLEEFFGRPTRLVFPIPEPPRRPGPGSPMVAMQGYVEVVYDVSERGRVGRVDVVDSRPDGLLDFRTRKAIRSARFRPRFEDGEAVATEDMRYRHEFVYFEAPEESGPGEETAAQQGGN